MNKFMAQTVSVLVLCFITLHRAESQSPISKPEMKRDHAEAVNLNNKGAYKMVDKGYRDAVKEFDAAIAIEPKYFLAYLNRGLAKEKLADYQGAVFDFSECIRINPDDTNGYFNRARCEQVLGDFGTAVADYTALIRLDQHAKLSLYYHQRALAKERLGNRAGATKDFRIEKDLREKNQ